MCTCCSGSALTEEGVVHAIPAMLWDKQALEITLLLKKSPNGLLLGALDCLAANGMAVLTCEDAVAVLDEHQCAGPASLLWQ